MTEERIMTYMESLARELPGYLEQLKKKARTEHVPIVRDAAISVLRFLLLYKKPESILEIGTAVGFSALLMKEYISPEGKITTLEKVKDRIKKAKENFAQYDTKGQITLLEGDAAELLKKLVQRQEKYDMIFMDAAKGQYLSFLSDTVRLLETDGILVSDNVLQEGDVLQSRYAVTRRDRTIHKRMREYLYILTHTEGMETLLLPMGDGMTLTFLTNKDKALAEIQKKSEKLAGTQKSIGD